MQRTTVSWREDLAVSHAAIDRDHKEIINRAGTLHTAVLALQERDVLLPLIADLLAVTEAHFAEEERLMLANSYPEYESHRNEHQRLLKQLRAVQQDVGSNAIRVGGLMALFLESWTEQHILSTDRALAAFLHARDMPA